MGKEKGKEKGKGDRRENEEGARGRRGGRHCFFDFLRSDSNRRIEYSSHIC